MSAAPGPGALYTSRLVLHENERRADSDSQVFYMRRCR